MIRVFDSAKIIELSKKYKIFHWGPVKIAVYIADGGEAETAAEPPPTGQQGRHCGGTGRLGDSDGIAVY